MNKNLFRGWKDVFSFTFRQGMNEKNFKLSTIGITTLLFLVGMAICVIMAWTQKKDATEVSPIEVVHIVDESGLELLYTEGFLEANKEKYPSLSFVTEDAEVEELSKNLAAKADEGSKDVILHLGTTDKGYQMTLYLPQGSELKKDEGEDFLEQVTMIMEQSKLFASGIPIEKLVYVMSSVSVTTLDAGEAEKSIGEELVAMLFPMLCMFFIYMMNMVYGQSIGTTVSVEKTSKLMEMVLTMTKPYSLIFGKIFAMTCIAILQTVCWIGGLVAGFLIGDKVAANVVYPGYSNLLLEVFELLRDASDTLYKNLLHKEYLSAALANADFYDVYYNPLYPHPDVLENKEDNSFEFSDTMLAKVLHKDKGQISNSRKKYEETSRNALYQLFLNKKL